MCMHKNYQSMSTMELLSIIGFSLETKKNKKKNLLEVKNDLLDDFV